MSVRGVKVAEMRDDLLFVLCLRLEIDYLFASTLPEREEASWLTT